MKKSGGGDSRSKSEYRGKESSTRNIEKKAVMSSAEQKQMAEELKRKMLKAKEASKKSEAFLAKLERSNFQSDPGELIEMDNMLD